MSIAKINLGIAFAAVANPAWLRFFTEISPALALLLQVLGIILAVLQIVRLLKDWKRPGP